MEGEKYIPVSTISSITDAQIGDELYLIFLGGLTKEGHKETFLPKSLYVSRSRRNAHHVG
jgi:hypothetical protein